MPDTVPLHAISPIARAHAYFAFEALFPASFFVYDTNSHQDVCGRNVKVDCF